MFVLDDFFIDDQVSCGVLFALFAGFFEEVPAAEPVFFDADFHGQAEFFCESHCPGDCAVRDVEDCVDCVDEVEVFLCELPAEVVSDFVDPDAFHDACCVCEVFVFEEAVPSWFLGECALMDVEVLVDDDCGSWGDVLDVPVVVLDQCGGF